ncbi:formylmethanofuran dehydrogenase, subunit G [Desulfacinum hydrothermale DSM 13146]|uniref:Formylmethanofuran dehydrogenase, subunit G n=1 Tax=Desulfacinum hydrothermale DSM 13146 TaxID=1121390 RepID=A0A1W1X9R3_9BACT|nr:4Fe-4S binding protein [Desulfacinum hydrothermale]SMC20567.1 formylmethanofuran dehydrogenase, subunit G [Desulfacinum hydrothermale DSM 13146]
MLKKIVECLPQTDCQMCGMTCADFAGFLLSGDLTTAECPVLQEPAYAEKAAALQELLASLARRAKSGHLIDVSRCNGCGICVIVCEYNLANSAACRLGKGPAADEKVALRVVNGQVVLADENLCTRLLQAADKCSKCQDHCPTQAIVLV